ncbi:hypothetical protein SDC9_52056 [bioreactor metagenome]|uniref:SAF domain-containing protein n=1 Tax=bioreactor metagenome TaxID=1076179 RepID=A0A644WQG3_9ZZZZ
MWTVRQKTIELAKFHTVCGVFNVKKVKILAIISAVVTALLLFIFLNSLKNSSNIARTRVIVAVTDIPANTSITAEMIKQTELPTEAVVAGTLSDASLVIGKIAEAEIFAGEQLLSSKLISAGSSDSKTLAYAIEPGMRAITIAVDETAGLSYMITPGNHVDIIAEFLDENNSAAGAVKTSYTTMVLQNIIVLAVDNILSEDGKLLSETPQYTAVTLQVTPQQAMELSMAQFEGELRLILRSPVDEESTNIPSLTLNNIMIK